MSDVAEMAAEATADVVEDAIDGVVDVVEVVRNNPIVLAAVGVLGLIAGGAGGYFIAMKCLANKYEEDLAFEIAQTRDFYAGVNKVTVEGEPITPQQALEDRHGPEAVAEVVRKYQGRTTYATMEEAVEAAGSPADEKMDEDQIASIERRLRERGIKEVVRTEEVEEVEYNVFEDTDFDYDEEVKHRTPDEPYIITELEFDENEPDFDSISLTYFEKDDTLVAEMDDDKPLEDKSIIGDYHLLRFGSGTKDKNKVFVRNEKIGTQYEIIRSNGSYLEEVLGIMTDEPDSLKHSNRNAQQRRRREFRHGDG